MAKWPQHRHGEFSAQNTRQRTNIKKSYSSSSLPYSFLRDSLQLQHTTNLNIQRSQSTQRFGNTIAENNNYDHENSVECTPNPEAAAAGTELFNSNETTNSIASGTNLWGESQQTVHKSYFSLGFFSKLISEFHPQN